MSIKGRAQTQLLTRRTDTMLSRYNGNHMNYLVTNRRPELRQIYQEWTRHNARHHALQILAVGTVVSVLLIGFDFLFFGRGAQFYFPYRLACSLALTALFLMVRGLQFAAKDFRNILVCATAGVLSLSLWNGIYLYFFLYGPQPHQHVVTAAIYMNIYVTQFFVQRFWRMQYFCMASMMMAIGFTILAYPEKRLELTSFALWNLCVFIICWLQRRAFCSALFLRYDSLRKQFPAKVARVVCTESPDHTLEAVFKPVLRPCACICLDWRSFQAYAASQPPEEVALRIQTVHDVVIAMVAETIADESYFADWTADEIFITVYSEQDDVEMVLRHTWAFCHAFQTTIRKRLINEIGSNVPIIDIGAAVGIALVGLVGPTSMKKTTIVGAVGGIAKRLQSAAKVLRETSSRSAAPILCINKDIYDYIRAKHEHLHSLVSPLIADSKDLQGHSIYVYAEALTEVPTEVRKNQLSS